MCPPGGWYNGGWEDPNWNYAMLCLSPYFMGLRRLTHLKYNSCFDKDWNSTCTMANRDKFHASRKSSTSEKERTFNVMQIDCGIPSELMSRWTIATSTC